MCVCVCCVLFLAIRRLAIFTVWHLDVNSQKVMVTGGGGGLTYFLWKVKKGVLWEHILNDIYHAVLNLSQRAAHMIEQDPEV